MKTLTITSKGGYDDSLRVALEQHLPELQEVQLVDVSFSKITLDAERTPNLRSVRLQNVPDDCELSLLLPDLRSFSIYYWNGDCRIINRMLQTATQLESFDSYKLWVDELHFASNALADINLHRSDALDTLTIWAPNLTRLGVQVLPSTIPVCFSVLQCPRRPQVRTIETVVHSVPKGETQEARSMLCCSCWVWCRDGLS